MPDDRPWAGWVRIPTSGWEKVCQHDDWGACWLLLLATRRPGSHVEMLVTRAENPDQRKRVR